MFSHSRMSFGSPADPILSTHSQPAGNIGHSRLPVDIMIITRSIIVSEMTKSLHRHYRRIRERMTEEMVFQIFPENRYWRRRRDVQRQSVPHTWYTPRVYVQTSQLLSSLAEYRPYYFAHCVVVHCYSIWTVLTGFYCRFPVDFINLKLFIKCMSVSFLLFFVMYVCSGSAFMLSSYSDHYAKLSSVISMLNYAGIHCTYLSSGLFWPNTLKCLTVLVIKWSWLFQCLRRVACPMRKAAQSFGQILLIELFNS